MEQPASPKFRILIADDDALARKIVERLGEELGWDICTVANGLSAAEQVKNAPEGYFSAVLLDMRMPILDGREAAGRIRCLGGARGMVPIYAMSGSQSELLRNPWASWLFNGCISKPLQAGELSALLSGMPPCTLAGQSSEGLDEHAKIRKLERLEANKQELDKALAQHDHRKAAEMALRIRWILAGHVPKDLLDVLEAFQFNQARKQTNVELIEEIDCTIEAARGLLKVA